MSISAAALCPFPICGDDGTAAMCIKNGHCGCDEQGRVNESAAAQVQDAAISQPANPESVRPEPASAADHEPEAA